MKSNRLNRKDKKVLRRFEDHPGPPAVSWFKGGGGPGKLRVIFIVSEEKKLPAFL